MRKAEEDRKASQENRDELRKIIDRERSKLIEEIELKAKEMIAIEFELKFKRIEYKNEVVRDQLKFSLETDAAEKRHLEMLLERERERKSNYYILM
jgi:methyl coenzyme M reductase subunit D